VYGKNLSGGIAPLCGISSRDDIMGDNVDFSSGSTFAGMPAGCAAAIKTLEIYERDHIVAHAKRLGNIAAGIMREWESYSIVRQSRGNGLLLGVSFGKPDSAGADEKDWWTRARCAGTDARERRLGIVRSPGDNSTVSRPQYAGVPAPRRT
jgi:acetylornithine/succinyldiaminopimelate/putrescine aminotransferase